jgi:hypothetical protein
VTSSPTSWPDLYDILKKRLVNFSYEDLIRVRPSGMTRMQEWLRTQGIKEDIKGNTDSREGYVAIPHPFYWTNKVGDVSRYVQYVLLVPEELAVKITTLGHIP